MKNDYHFYDTSALLEKSEDLFKEKEKIVISTTVLEELENIKTSRKDERIKRAARHILNILDKHNKDYEVINFLPKMLKPIKKKGFEEETNDLKILAAAIYYDTYHHPDETIFITNDMALKNIANVFFGQDCICSIKQNNNNDYKGYLEVKMDNYEMAYLYENLNKNIYNLLCN